MKDEHQSNPLHYPSQAIELNFSEPRPTMISSLKESKLKISRRISQQQIITDSTASESLLQSVVCPVCLLLLPVPHYICERCDNTFCPSCLEGWWEKNPKNCIFKCENAEFKVVKRSNTYNALMDILKIKCTFCEGQIPISTLQTHEEKLCKKKIIRCKNYECDYETERGLMEGHEQTCQHKQVQCEYCKLKMKLKQKTEHQEQKCQVRVIKCHNQQCKEQITANRYAFHLKNCPFRQQQCKYCSNLFLSKDLFLHYSVCQKRMSTCPWCKQEMQYIKLSDHQQKCQLRMELCQLCETQIRSLSKKEHRQECMFSNLCKIKFSNQILTEENIKLRVKVMELQELLKDSLESRESETLKTLLSMRKKELDELKKDLLRVTNSMKAVQKLHKQELDEHLKMPHMSYSWCPFCKSIKAKYKQMLEPLEVKKQEITCKIVDLQRIQYTPKGH